jgi:hypothetical protein
MTILLNNVYVALKGHHKHRSSALLDIHPQRNNLSYKVKELFQLTQLKYIVGNKIGKELLIEENIASCSKRYYNLFTQKYPRKYLLRY